jgi:hypothetical protein
MRYLCELSAGVVVVGLGLAAVPNHADAGPVPSIAIKTAAPLVQTIDYWRRYCRRYGCPPPAIPGADLPLPAQVPLADDAPVAVVPVVPLPPPRPLSCGEFRYWDGERCLDARYNKPYLGPR